MNGNGIDTRPAAFYGRRSLEQRGVSEEEKSVTLQLQLAQACAAKRGETIATEYIFTDEESGREFDRRADFVRLMDLAKRGKRAPFKTLYIAAQDRLGREQWETLYTFKKLDQAGVTIVPYRKGEPLKFDTPAERFALQALQFAADQEAANASERSREKMIAKARAGHVVGSKVYGYDHERTTDAAGNRGHAVYIINKAEAEVVVMIFELAASGAGFMQIVNALEARGVPAPRRRSTRWTPNTIRRILTNPRYRGEAFYMKTSQRNHKWGDHEMTKHPEASWISMPVPAIVSTELWNKAAAHRARKTAALAALGPRGGKLHDGQSKYLLTNFARCSVCGGPMAIKSIPPKAGEPRSYAYQCLTYHRRGPKACTNATTVPVARAEAAVVAAILSTLSPEFAGKVAEQVRRLVTERRSTTGARTLHREIARLDAAIENLTEAIETAGNVKALAGKLAARQAEAERLRGELAALERPSPIPAALLASPAKLQAAIARELAEMTKPLRDGKLEEMRAIFRQWLDGPIVFTPAADPARRGKHQPKNTRRFAFEGRIRVVGTFAGLAGELSTIGKSRTAIAEGGFARFEGIAA